MIKVSVLYPQAPGTRFDHEYYRDRHLPLVRLLLGAACTRHTIDRGLAGTTPDAPPPFVAGCELYFENLADFQAAFGADDGEIVADVPRYTDRTPLMQISEVVVG